MYRYRNKKSGAVIDTACKVESDYWEPVWAPDCTPRNAPETSTGCSDGELGTLLEEDKGGHAKKSAKKRSK